MFGTSSPDDVAAAFSAVAPTYDDHYSTPADLADSEVIFGRARRLFRKGPPGVLIDLGCGPGTALAWNVASPHDYLGIDLAEGMIEEARLRWPGHTFVHGDHHAIRPSSAVFILGGFGPIQYVHPHERPHFARAVVGGLVPGGRFLLMARPRQIATSVLDHDVVYPVTARRLEADFLLAGAEDVTVKGHRRYTMSTWRVRVQTTSLQVESLFPFQADRAEWLVVEGRRPGGWYARFT